MDVETSGRFRLAVTIKLAADLAKPAIDGLGRCIPFQRIMQLLEIANHPCLIRILPNGTHPDQGLIGAQRGLLTTLGNQLGQ